MKKTILIIAALVLVYSGKAMAAVTWQAAGTAVSGTVGVGANPVWPVHAVNDIALLFVESTGGQPVTLSVPNGFAAVPNSPQATGAGTAGTQLTVFWARATSAAMAAPVITSPSDHFYARIITFRGVINTGNPWDVTGGGVKAAASTSVTVTGVTTTVANTLIVQAVARDNDNAAAAFSAEANANLTGIAERLDAGTTNGNGGGLGVWTGIKATAGATGNTTANVTNSINAFLTIALKPQPAPPAFQAAGTAVDGTASVSPAWPAHAVGDIALLFVESAGGQPAALSTPAGFVAVPNSPQATGVGIAGTRISVFWARATSTAMATPTVADAGDHVYARILTYRGVVNTGNPWDVTGGGVKTPASTSVVVTGVTTTVANTRIVQVVARDNDSAAAAFSAETNVNLTGILERSDAGTNRGNGGGFAVWDGAMAAAGATGNTTATVTSSINAFLTIALAPNTALTPPPPVYQALSAATASLNWPAHLIDDVALLFVESAGGQPVTLSVPNGFAAVPNSPQATGAGTAGTQLTVFWARATSAAMAGPTLTTPADHLYAQIITYRGAINTGNPWDVTGGGVKAAASNSVTVTGVTTMVANTLIVQAVARSNDSAAAAFSAEANANLTGIAERSDAGTTTGLGGGFAVWDGAKATAGATGNTTATVTNSINAFLTIALKPPVAGPDHIQISHDGSALTCSPDIVTITACANALCTLPHYSGGANVALTPGGQIFAIDATGINSAATVQQSTIGAATLAAISVPAATNATTCWNTATSTASCAMTFNDSGFVVTVPNHTSCSNATATIEAVQTAPGTGRCVPAYQNVTRAVNLYSTYVSPATGTQVVTASTGVVSTAGPGTTHNLVFDATGKSTITLSYPDAGQLTLTASDTAPTGAAMTGNSTFVVAPASFAFSAIPAAPLTAGQAFNATVTAMNACATPAATPNFNGTVTITSSNPQPAIGNATAINTTLSGFSNGAASTNLTWDEVGTIDLNANLANYLGSGLSVSGTQAGVGRFRPAYFDTVVTPGCNTFTYAGSTAPAKAGQPFTVTVKAKRFGGDTTDATNTANYAGANAYLTTLSNAGVTTGLASNTIAAANFANGVGSATNVTYEVATPQTVPLTLTLRATDADTNPNPTPVSSSGHTEGTTEIRSGRAKLGNAHGSELLPLSIPFRAEYWDNGWVLNPADICSGDGLSGGTVSVALSALPATCVQDTGNPGLSGAGCAAAGPAGQRFTKGGVAGFAGDFNLWLNAPGAGNTGAVTVTGNVPSWLQYPWGGGADVNPAGRATFGVYKGADEFIYMRENY